MNAEYKQVPIPFADPTPNKQPSACGASQTFARDPEECLYYKGTTEKQPCSSMIDGCTWEERNLCETEIDAFYFETPPPGTPGAIYSPVMYICVPKAGETATCNECNTDEPPETTALYEGTLEEICANSVDDDCDGSVDEVTCPTPTPTPSPTPDCGDSYEVCTLTGYYPANYCLYPLTGCAEDDGVLEMCNTCCVSGGCVEPPVEYSLCDWDQVWSNCLGCCMTPYGNCWASPVLIDVDGDGFNLTNASHGVDFDLDADGVKEHLSWTSRNSDEAWLTLDRNDNGKIDDGTELFGNFTPQPNIPRHTAKNGFIALAEYDRPESGGNSDGIISRDDEIFSKLRLWQDVNHDGKSKASELFKLSQLGLKKIFLDYQISKRIDGHGNRFMWRAKIKDTNDAQLGRWAWDVILRTSQ